MSSALLFLVQAAALPSASAPSITVPPAPVVERYRADVRIVVGHKLLWSGSLKVGGGITHVSFRANQPDRACAAPDGSYRADGSGWTLGLLARAGRRGEQVLDVSAGWTRPDFGACASDDARYVNLTAVTHPQPGRWIVLRGDGGLVVKLRRR